MRFARTDQRSIAHLISFTLRLDGESREDGECFLALACGWCEDRFPREDRTDRTRWYTHGWTIRFREENDAFEFRMRWC